MATTIPFNTLALEKAAPRNGKPTEHKVDGVPGLILRVEPTGSATFYVRYTVGKGAERRFRREKIGRRDFKVLPLAEVRKQALALMSNVAKGEDPVAEAAVAAKTMTLTALFEERLAKDGDRSGDTLANYKRVLENDVFPTLGHLPANAITADQIADVLEVVEARSKHVAHVARSALGSTYRWAVKRRAGGVRVNPTAGLGFIVRAPIRERRLDDKELAKLWAAIGTTPSLSEPVRIILQLAALTAQRRTEVVGARRSELTLEGDNPVWRIAGSHSAKGKAVEGRMKSKRLQVVPLSTQAVALFTRALELAGNSDQVFPSDTQRAHGTKPKLKHLAPTSISHAMSKVTTEAKIEDARLHDLRKVVASWMLENGVGLDVVDLVLHHARQGVTSSHYDFSNQLPAVRRALQSWADHIWKITGQSAGASNVVPMRA
ncbi:MAG: tyrosine-type recombinase/integrase [Hyphomicrobium sp.]